MTMEISLAHPVGAPSTEGELTLLRAALARQPDSVEILVKLARLLNRLDRFGEAIALLEGSRASLDVRLALASTRAYLARRQPGDDALALAAANEALTLARDHRATAAALAERGLCHARMNDPSSAQRDWRAALAVHPHNHSAFEHLATHMLAAGEPMELLSLCDTLVQQRVSHSLLFSMQSRSLAIAGDIAAAATLIGLQRFATETLPSPPIGWSGGAAFNQALANEILTHPDLRGHRHGTASVASQRVDHPTSGNTPALAALLRLIVREVQAYVAAQIDGDHPWLSARPSHALLDCQAVVTRAEGHERWHMHSNGWLSGGYYPLVPDDMASGDALAGCLELGMPPQMAGQSASNALGSRIIRPGAGLLALFPSHIYHRTFPHGAAGQRICIAFDVKPV